MAEIDGRWPWPARVATASTVQGRLRRPCPTRDMPKRQTVPLGHSQSTPALPACGKRDQSAPGPRVLSQSAAPFYDVDQAGGFKMSLSNKVGYLDQRYSLMRPCSAARFPTGRKVSDDPGPGSYTLHQWPQSTDTSAVSPSESSVVPDNFRGPEGTAVFKSGQPRVPTNCTSWLFLRNRTAELGDGPFEADERRRLRHFNGRPKGAFFKGSSRGL
mmetsp:Transcript_137253/g.382861  ORF Transcript_137253/g.382861 Transcript_137253/m.382861 type:complete len:215 (+) Transcript_137253:33-677(+)